MGRIALLGTSLGSGVLSHTYTALDLFRLANPGVRQLTAGNPAYFSPDGGTTRLNNFNTVSAGDAGDWASGGGNNSYNAFVSSGVAEPVTVNDLRVMDVIAGPQRPRENRYTSRGDAGQRERCREKRANVYRRLAVRCQ